MSKRRRYDAVSGYDAGWFRFQISPAQHRQRMQRDFEYGGSRLGRRRRQRLHHARVK